MTERRSNSKNKSMSMTLHSKPLEKSELDSESAPRFTGRFLLTRD